MFNAVIKLVLTLLAVGCMATDRYGLMVFNQLAVIIILLDEILEKGKEK